MVIIAFSIPEVHASDYIWEPCLLRILCKRLAKCMLEQPHARATIIIAAVVLVLPSPGPEDVASYLSPQELEIGLL